MDGEEGTKKEKQLRQLPKQQGPYSKHFIFFVTYEWAK
jgi:hypothetical protein